MRRHTTPASTVRATRTALRRLLLAACLVVCSDWAGADTWIDTHDEPAAAWHLDQSQGARELQRKRVRVGGKLGEEVGAEHLAYAAAPGTVAWAWRAIPPAAVIDELKIELDARISVPGALLAAEIVLPHTRGEKDHPIRLRVRSARNPSAPLQSSKQGDTQLTLAAFPKLMQREVRVWRLANRGKSIDTRGAYVSRVGLALPGAGGPAQAWIREIRAESIVTPLKRTEAGLTVRSVDPDDPDTDPSDLSAAASGRIEPTRVTLRSDGFRIDGELFFPRIWRWRGESFRSLASRGINTVWLPGAPTKAALTEAAQNRLRLLCPPPKPSAAATRTPDRVLAWVLEGPLDAKDLDAGLVQIEAVRAITGAAQRPLLASVRDDAAAWARVVDGVILEPEISRTTLAKQGTLAEPAVGLTVPPGTPTFAVVSLEVGPQVAGQLDALLGDGVALTWLPPADIAAAVHQAIKQSACGIAFTSTERIDGADDASRAAAGWLEATNRRLRLLEPWLVGPRSTRVLDRHDGVLIDRGGVRLAAFTPFRLTNPTGTDAVLLPGLNSTAKVSRLTVAGLNSWTTERITGGVGARRPGGPNPGDLVMSNDPRVVRSLKSYTHESSALAAKKLAEIAIIRIDLAESLTPEARRKAESLLGESRLAASRRDHAVAFDAAHAALAIVAEAETQHRAIANATDTLESTPLAILPGTLVDHFRMAQLLATVPRGENRLFGGSFEDIDDLRRHGWRHTSESPKPTESDRPELNTQASGVELATTEPIHGQRILRLRDAGGSSRIVSPEVTLEAGETIEISGWARVTGDAGLLRITDTLGGNELALEASDTGDEWKPFRLLRATAVNATVQLTFETRGQVTADLDGVMIRTVRPTGLANRPRRTR